MSPGGPLPPRGPRAATQAPAGASSLRLELRPAGAPHRARGYPCLPASDSAAAGAATGLPEAYEKGILVNAYVAASTRCTVDTPQPAVLAILSMPRPSARSARMRSSTFEAT